MSLVLVLGCVGAFLITALVALVTGQWRATSALVYGASLAIAMFALIAALFALLGNQTSLDMTLPIGLPWIGAHFHLDALSAFFLAIVNLGAAAAGLYAIGYGAHESEPQRVLPFFPAFLAGMNLVVLAADTFSFLFSWELMSLASWALVLAHHEREDNRQAGYVYIVMASFGTLALLLAFSLLSGASGFFTFADIRAHLPSSTIAATVLALALLGAG